MDGGSRRVAGPLVLLVLLLTGCTADGADRARDKVFSDARETVRAVEVADVSRGNLGPGSVDYLRSTISGDGDQVLDSWSKPGSAAADELVGWVDAAFARRSTNDTFSSGGTAVVCLRFEVRWSDSRGAAYDFHEVDCPPGATPAVS